jgi:hypothetical protein
MAIQVKGFTNDCLIWGHMDTGGRPLARLLNHLDRIELRDVTLESLDSAQRVRVPAYSLGRDELCALTFSEPRPRSIRRPIRSLHRLQAQIGPYHVLGRVDAAPGDEPLWRYRAGGAMVAFADATIAYIVGGVLELRDAQSVVVNRDLVNWVRTVDPATGESRGYLTPSIPDAIA